MGTPGKIDLDALMDRYNSLSVPDQKVLQALATLMEPVTAQATASCLMGAGCRESPLRAFSAQNVLIRLIRLAREGFAAEFPEGRKSPAGRLWACSPPVGEMATRHAVRDGTFIPLSRAVLAAAGGRDRRGGENGDSARRRFRLAFHAGDWAGSLREFGVLRRENPGQSGSFLNRLISDQPDDSWRRNLACVPFAGILIAAIEDLILGLGPPGEIGGIAGELLAAPGPENEWDELAASLVNLLILRGKISEAKKAAERVRREEVRLSGLLGAALAAGDDGLAANLAESAVAARRSRLGTREAVLPGFGAFWQMLAAISGDSPDAGESLLRRLTPDCLANHALGGALSSLRLVMLYLRGEASAAGMPDRPSDRHPLASLAHGLARFCLHPERPPAPPELWPAREKAAAAAGYAWLAGQFRCLAAAGDPPAPKTGKWPSLLRIIPGDEGWRRGLRALESWAAGGTGVTAGKARKRLAWMVGRLEHPPNPLAPFRVYPVEQILGRNGAWSRGRDLSRSRLPPSGGRLPHATEQDRRLLDKLRRASAAFDRFDSPDLLPLLVGHPLVFWDDGDSTALEVAAGEFGLAAVERDGGCLIALEPALADFRPAHSPDGGDGSPGPGGSGVGEAPETAARLETPVRIRVFPFGQRERRLAELVGEGLIVPPHGREEALRILTSLSGRVDIQSDFPDLAGAGQLVAAESKPYLYLIPFNPGLGVEIWAHPLGISGPAFRPGRGGRAVAGVVEGRPLRAVRDLDREKEAAAAVLAACPGLRDRLVGDSFWRLDDPAEALSFLAETEELAGKAAVVWPKGGRSRVRKCRISGGLSLRVRAAGGWFELDGDLRVDENLVLDLARLLSSRRRGREGVVELGEGEYLLLAGELNRQLGDLEAMGELREGKLRLSPLTAPLLEGLELGGASLAADPEWRRILERRKALADFSPPPPGGFLAELRDYQLDGYRWLARLAEAGAGACLADDMGLGKTIQALAILTGRAGLGPALVVAPTSVCHNWGTEASRFAPALRMFPLRENGRRRQVSGLGPGDVVITSYALLRREQPLLAEIKWGTVVLDEAQAIKNFSTRRSRAAMALEAGFRLITTGTPIENHLSELWNLFHFINPGLLGPLREFQERFAVPIERFRDEGARERLRRIIRPFILRRTKGQVLASLPAKTEITLTVELGPEERAFYESLRRVALERLEGGRDARPREKSLMILAEIMRLRRACCSPELISPGAGLPSAKQEQFRLTLAELLENGHKALVFSQFVDHLSIIRGHLDAAGYPYQYLDGSTPPGRRREAVEAFQAGEGEVFLLSLKAGGLGLNLTAADYVIHMDPWWNPAVEDQASDRAHRIGQEKPVTVYRLVAGGTIEEKIVRLHHDKRDLADTLLAGSEQAGAGLDWEELLGLLRDE
ncbi:MAG: DEAD/DEAH box helicase [Planctomycetota bacterium]|jgi:superfamily II DNA or RNA helicase|nr:DEAD/DEAH box helicase [Planctomycetota bacterium]